MEAFCCFFKGSFKRTGYLTMTNYYSKEKLPKLQSSSLNWQQQFKEAELNRIGSVMQLQVSPAFLRNFL